MEEPWDDYDSDLDADVDSGASQDEREFGVQHVTRLKMLSFLSALTLQKGKDAPADWRPSTTNNFIS